MYCVIIDHEAYVAAELCIQAIESLIIYSCFISMP